MILSGSPDWPGMINGDYDGFMFEAAARDGVIEGATVWDVGAHVGYHTLNFAAMVGPQGRVVAFEPNPANAARLRANIAGNPHLAERITVAEYPLSDHDGEQEFVFSSGVDSGKSQNSHLADASLPLDVREYIGYVRRNCVTRRIDSLVDEGTFGTPELVKIDVEGAESLVVAGGSSFFAAEKPRLLMEIHNVTNMFHVQRQLFPWGYRIKLLDEENSGLSRCFLYAAVSPVEALDTVIHQGHHCIEAGTSRARPHAPISTRIRQLSARSDLSAPRSSV